LTAREGRPTQQRVLSIGYVSYAEVGEKRGRTLHWRSEKGERDGLVTIALQKETKKRLIEIEISNKNVLPQSTAREGTLGRIQKGPIRDWEESPDSLTVRAYCLSTPSAGIEEDWTAIRRQARESTRVQKNVSIVSLDSRIEKLDVSTDSKVERGAAMVGSKSERSLSFLY